MSPAPARATLAGAPVTVCGLGLFGGGVAAARWLAAAGARVTVTDLRDRETLAPALAELADLELRLVLGEHRPEDFERAALVVANPAVPPTSPYLARARAAGVPISSEMELFLAHCRARLALITGTQGKSSTASFLAQLLTASGVPARLGGNVGAPLLAAVEAIGADEVCALEISSYQLEALSAPPLADPPPRVEVVVVTNVLADHLERHGDAGAYAEAKARALELASPGATVLLPADRAREDRFRRRLPPGARCLRHPGEARIEDGRFRLGEEDLGAVADLRVPGTFQRDNALVALAVARALGAPAERLRGALGRLEALPHRMQALGSRAGVRVVDNGVSTTPESTVAALRSLSGPCTLLAGGRAKRGLDYPGLAAELAARGVALVAFGAAAGALAEEAAAAGVAAEALDTLEEAVARALARTPRGGTLLFSPACASFDRYPNFRARALAFRAALGEPH